ncbi:hypothetical protein DPV78_006618 [Talaromyces pinophilus]|nr:hypothetical protein DPV78_006618 [Talaromyces pinophilus]
MGLSEWFHLGLLAAIYTVMIHPLSMFLAYSLGSNLLTSSVYTTFSDYNNWRNLRRIRGPVWYLATLPSLDTLATFQKLYTTCIFRDSLRVYLLFPVKLPSTASTFFLRLSWPVGTSLPLIEVQPAFLP